MSKHDAYIHGEIGDDGSHPGSPNYREPDSVLDCPNETGTWLAEHMAETIQVNAIEIIGDWLTGPRDEYADRKAARQLMELAKRCDDAIHEVEEQDRRNAA